MKPSEYRIERDSMGELKVPADALWGAQTQRAVNNFPISGRRLPRAFIRALALIKQAAATANASLGLLDPALATAIAAAAGEVAARAVGDRHFTHGETRSDRERGEEGIHRADRQERCGDLAAEEFERITSLLNSGGEVAPVDLTRAQLQTITRRDELERARANEEVAAGSLRVLVGYEFSAPISTTDLAFAAPVSSEFQQFKVGDISRRPDRGPVIHGVSLPFWRHISRR